MVASENSDASWCMSERDIAEFASEFFSASGLNIQTRSCETSELGIQMPPIACTYLIFQTPCSAIKCLHEDSGATAIMCMYEDSYVRLHDGV